MLEPDALSKLADLVRSGGEANYQYWVGAGVLGFSVNNVCWLFISPGADVDNEVRKFAHRAIWWLRTEGCVDIEFTLLLERASIRVFPDSLEKAGATEGAPEVLLDTMFSFARHVQDELGKDR